MGKYLNNLIIKDISKNKIEIAHKEIKLTFYTPNRLCFGGQKLFFQRNQKL